MATMVNFSKSVVVINNILVFKIFYSSIQACCWLHQRYGEFAFNQADSVSLVRRRRLTVLQFCSSILKEPLEKTGLKPNSSRFIIIRRLGRILPALCRTHSINQFLCHLDLRRPKTVTKCSSASVFHSSSGTYTPSIMASSKKISISKRFKSYCLLVLFS